MTSIGSSQVHSPGKETVDIYTCVARLVQVIMVLMLYFKQWAYQGAVTGTENDGSVVHFRQP